MAPRSDAVNMEFLKRLFKPPFLLDCEYWVFGKDLKVPDLTALIGKTTRDKHPLRLPLGKAEAVVFTDIRFSMALALKDKNPYAFRPDILDFDVEPTQEILARLAEANSFIRLRFLSKIPVNNRAHLRLLPRLASAVSKLAGGIVVFDQITRRIWTNEAYEDLLNEHVEPDCSALHTRLKWVAEKDNQHFETLGFVKLGLEEWKSEPLDKDQTVLAQAIIEDLIERVWVAGQVPESADIEEFGDHFLCKFFPPKDGKRTVALSRRLN